VLATYAIVAHVVAWTAGGGVLTVRVSDLVWLALLVAFAATVVSRRSLGAVLLRRDRAPALAVVVASVLVPLAVPVLARTVANFGPPLVALGWPWTVTFVAGAAVVTALAGPRSTAPDEPRPPAAI
jgi:hypothetical protein